MNRMIPIPHRPDNDLGAIKHPLPAIPSGIPTEEGGVRVLEIEILESFPYLMDCVGEEGDLRIKKLVISILAESWGWGRGLPYSDTTT